MRTKEVAPPRSSRLPGVPVDAARLKEMSKKAPRPVMTTFEAFSTKPDSARPTGHTSPTDAGITYMGNGKGKKDTDKQTDR